MATIELVPYRAETLTATLTVTGRSLAISQWSDQPVVQLIRFQLTVHTDRDPIEIRGKQAGFMAVKALLQRYLQGVLGQATQPVTESGLTLEPEGLSQHRLTLGPLTSDPVTPSLLLTVVELADWVDLFDQLEGQVRCLPVPLNQNSKHRLWQQWRSLAAGFIVAVGTVAVWPYLNQDRFLPTARQAPTEETLSSVETTEAAETGSLANADVEPEQAVTDESADAETVRANPAKPETLDQPQPKNNTPPDSQTQPEEVAEEPQEPLSVPPPAPEDGIQAPEAIAASEPPPNPIPNAARTPESAADSPQTTRSERITDTEDSLPAESAPGPEVGAPLALENTPLPRQWNPPAGFTGTLSYQITLTTEGRIEAIAPVDDQSAEYQNQIALPAIGTVINESAETLNVFFYEDGTVEILTESP